MLVLLLSNGEQPSTVKQLQTNTATQAGSWEPAQQYKASNQVTEKQNISNPHATQRVRPCNAAAPVAANTYIAHTTEAVKLYTACSWTAVDMHAVLRALSQPAEQTNVCSCYTNSVLAPREH
jgi:hypothetical protein